MRHFYGLMTVKGHFERYDGALDLSTSPAVELTIEADSVNTKVKKRDEHLRSADFFDAERHPQVRFLSDTATVDGDTLKVCYDLSGQERPVRFESKKKSLVFLAEYRRVKQ